MHRKRYFVTKKKKKKKKKKKRKIYRNSLAFQVATSVNLGKISQVRCLFLFGFIYIYIYIYICHRDSLFIILGKGTSRHFCRGRERNATSRCETTTTAVKFARINKKK
jgi:hypothetical protein